jgi:peptidoglycan/xylan/chitin deacetylase (PgdA/CDA1 family)
MFKKTIASIVYACYRVLGLFVRFQEVSILTYHSISDEGSTVAIRPEVFESHLKLLQERGYSFVSLAAIVGWYRSGVPLPRRAVAVSFDDGYADFETQALPILAKYEAPATLFVMSDAEASRPRLHNDIPLLSHDALERVQALPLVEVGFHGKTHANAAKLSERELRNEMERPRAMRYFAYPGGSYSHEAMRVAQQCGYAAAFSIKPGLVTKERHLFVLPRNVIEKGMTPWDVRLRVTQAFHWYAHIARWFK